MHNEFQLRCMLQEMRAGDNYRRACFSGPGAAGSTCELVAAGHKQEALQLLHHAVAAAAPNASFTGIALPSAALPPDLLSIPINKGQQDSKLILPDSGE